MVIDSAGLFPSRTGFCFDVLFGLSFSSNEEATTQDSPRVEPSLGGNVGDIFCQQYKFLKAVRLFV